MTFDFEQRLQAVDFMAAQLADGTLALQFLHSAAAPNAQTPAPGQPHTPAPLSSQAPVLGPTYLLSQADAYRLIVLLGETYQLAKGTAAKGKPPTAH